MDVQGYTNVICLYESIIRDSEHIGRTIRVYNQRREFLGVSLVLIEVRVTG